MERFLTNPKLDSPAADAKIETGDVVTAVNGLPLESWRDFIPKISATAPETTIYLTTYRDGQSIERSVTLGYSNCSRQRQ